MLRHKKNLIDLSQKQRDELWGETGPYSQAKLIIETRILDDRVSRVFIIVEADINPLTFKIINKNRSKFDDDRKIIQLLDHAKYRGQAFGYVACAFQAEYIGESAMEKAQKHLEYTKETIIKMHKLIMNEFGISNSQF